MLNTAGQLSPSRMLKILDPEPKLTNVKLANYHDSYEGNWFVFYAMILTAHVI